MAARPFDLNDVRQVITEMKASKIPELLGKAAGARLGPVGGEVLRIQGIIDSMTPDERRIPHGIDASRERRIAAGAGVPPSEVSDFLREFDRMAAFVKQTRRPL